PLVVVAAALVPRAAAAVVSIEAFYGIARPDAADFESEVEGAQDDPDLFDNSLQIAGGNVIFHLGTLELGAIVDTSFDSGHARQLAIGGLVGVGFDLAEVIRIEALGEVGAQRYGDFTEDRDIVTSSSSDQWFAYVGLRPGIAFHFNPYGPGFVLGLWGFVRWDLDSTEMDVTVASADDVSPGSIELGGTTIGAVARLGVEF
ncbi:MAG TPA: hypothetical protein VD838_07070, partial [Anaeromyxobacteraceae bacterium]|nr:hypothetical protein [Anaeromyxobacteraceae bacterium]